MNRTVLGLVVPLFSAFVALGPLCCLLACATAETEREDLIVTILRERAAHLHRSERREIARELSRAERETGVHALLLLAVAEEESHFRVEAKSRRGALGLLQVRPATARDVAARHRIRWSGPPSLFEPSVNIRIGAAYLAELEERFGAWDPALTAYNRGPTAARKAVTRGRRPTSRYAGRVLKRFAHFQEMLQRPGSA
jgi:soluble lytic murein transglycosylase